MGDLKAKATGIFYLETNKKEPFGKQKKRTLLTKIKNLLRSFIINNKYRDDD